MPQNLDATVSREDMEAKLKETITHAKETNVMHTFDWDNMPLPQHLIRQERIRRLLVPKPVVQTHAQELVSPEPAAQEKNPRKRKSTELVDGNHAPNPPWRNAANGNGNPLEDRISRPPPQNQAAQDDPKPSKLQKQLEKRQRRFDGGYKSTYRSPSPPATAGPVVGTSQTLEKRYLRLTSAPIPSQVRPEPILRQTLELLKKKWKKEANYSYICDQFKSMRQDLTVQRIKDEFTVAVYEIHARIALEKGDLGEYNQCQTQLRALYALGLKGNPVEFKAYRILYFIHTANRSAMNDALADLTAAEKEERPIKHALDVRSSLALGNYHRFFQLYLDTPNMGAYLMDMFVARERLAALANLCRA